MFFRRRTLPSSSTSVHCSCWVLRAPHHSPTLSLAHDENDHALQLSSNETANLLPPLFAFSSFSSSSSTSSHRTPISHSCNHPSVSLTPQQLLTKSLISSAFQPTPPTTSTPSVPAGAPKKKRKALSPAIELLRIQQGAVPGRGEVRERKDRWHVRVGVDLEGEIVGREDAGEGEEESTGKEGEKGVYFRRVSLSSPSSRLLQVEREGSRRASSWTDASRSSRLFLILCFLSRRRPSTGSHCRPNPSVYPDFQEDRVQPCSREPKLRSSSLFFPPLFSVWPTYRPFVSTFLTVFSNSPFLRPPLPRRSLLSCSSSTSSRSFLPRASPTGSQRQRCWKERKGSISAVWSMEEGFGL